MAAALIPFVLLGLGGSVHCMGMCGGFAALVGEGARRKGRLGVAEQCAYIVGKALTYVVLGLALALATELLLRRGAGLAEGGEVHQGHVLTKWRSVMAWVAGGVMVVLGLRVCDLRLPRLLRRSSNSHGPSLLARVTVPLQRYFRSIAALPGLAGAFGVGALTGFLPCGLSFGALALAAASPPIVAVLGMLLFGLCTGPALAVVGLGWSGLSPRLRQFAGRAAGPLLIVFGVLTIARGGLPESVSAVEGALPDCCAPASSE